MSPSRAFGSAGACNAESSVTGVGPESLQQQSGIDAEGAGEVDLARC